MESVFTLIMLSAVVSGIPNSACPFSRTTKNSHFLLLFLYAIITTYVPSWVITVLLYVFNFMWFLMVFVSWDSITPGNNFLNICQGIIFPSLPVYILYGIIMLLLPIHISNLAVIINQFLLKHTELILFWDCLLYIPVTLLVPFHWPPSSYCGKSSGSVQFYCTPCMPCHMLGIALAGGSPPQYLQGCHGVLWSTCVLALFSFTFLDIFIWSNYFDSINIFNTAA